VPRQALSADSEARLARLREILDRNDQLHREAQAREAAARAQLPQEPLFDFSPPKMPDLPSTPPREENHGPPLVGSQLWQGDPQGTAGPPEDDRASDLLMALGMIVPFLVLVGLKWAEERDVNLKPRIRASLAAIGAWRRRNAALLIVVGAAIVAASLTILRAGNLPGDYYEIRGLLRDGWLTFGGAIIAIIGIYDKIRAEPPSKI
jgi:hypothetical protein